MDDKTSLISVTDKIKTSGKYDYIVDMKVNAILSVNDIFVNFLGII